MVAATPRRGIDRVVARLAEVGARLRRDRLLHPDGAVFEATFTVLAGPPTGAPLLDRPGPRRALVRLSKATSTPRAWPDVLGLAVRVFDDEGQLDLALSTTGQAVVLRHLLVPRRNFATATFGSLLPYRVGDSTCVLAAVGRGPHPGLPARMATLPGAVAARPLTMEVLLAPVTGPWRQVALLELGEPSREDPRFDVVGNTVRGIAPAGWLNRLRDPIYRGSRRGAPHPANGGAPGSITDARG
ncbi:catalase family protein [Actinophytocola xanthii]|uniref:Phosphodiesterase n=1 Tax=Actinophytocola xanthii TaxID=1912961 RepID=A0A1Q8CPM6_9PSEU|nr:hypothetical protein [Actinophytocola xanthii]OLF16296.1 hypothetical protein BU204_17050 [Actinophytocola xanthii]